MLEENVPHDRKVDYPVFNFVHRWPTLAMVIAKCANGIMLAPGLRYTIFRSFNMICLYIAVMHKRQNFHHMYKLMLTVLSYQYWREPAQAKQWWFLMRLFVALLQEQQIYFLRFHPKLEEELIRLGFEGPAPVEGYDVSYSYVGFALWKFERAEIHEAINLIKTAVLADSSWGYPEYLYGWFGLFTSDVDSVEHFSKAIQLDWSFFHRLKRDKVCQQFPEILKAVNKRVLVQNKISSVQ